jgi:hypothetical protein
MPTEFESVRRFGACGVGLFRSEFLLSRPGMLLSEDEQFGSYRSLAEAAGAEGAIIRLFDLEAKLATNFRPLGTKPRAWSQSNSFWSKERRSDACPGKGNSARHKLWQAESCDPNGC